ncbi:hypothetical protein E2C01_036051 [Portunus trituberculatus]|uniref:Uncharacterized protein n=1 Tax=Portunus trituberculatus TaxID=210409 RepID=A0A5B7FAZ3_PORTR|nr:hypothetical protein [Portunus trituberculatus]
MFYRGAVKRRSKDITALPMTMKNSIKGEKTKIAAKTPLLRPSQTHSAALAPTRKQTPPPPSPSRVP